jgi:hypothetical protein
LDPSRHDGGSGSGRPTERVRGKTNPKVYQDQTGRSVDVSGVLLAVETYVAKGDVLTELWIAAGSMSRETKEKPFAPHILLCSPTSRLPEKSAIG